MGWGVKKGDSLVTCGVHRVTIQWGGWGGDEKRPQFSYLQDAQGCPMGRGQGGGGGRGGIKKADNSVTCGTHRVTVQWGVGGGVKKEDN